MLPDALTQEQLRALMASHNMTQYRLAKELSITREQVNKWYNGKGGISKVWSMVIRQYFANKVNR